MSYSISYINDFVVDTNEQFLIQVLLYENALLDYIENVFNNLYLFIFNIK